MLKSGMVRTLSDTKWFGSRFEGSLLGPYIFLGLFLGFMFKPIRIKKCSTGFERLPVFRKLPLVWAVLQGSNKYHLQFFFSLIGNLVFSLSLRFS